MGCKEIGSVTATLPHNCLSATAAADKCRPKNKIRVNTQLAFGFGFHGTLWGSDENEKTWRIAFPPSDIYVRTSFWLCTAYVRETGFKTGEESDPARSKLFSSLRAFFSFLPFRSLKYSAGRQWWYQQQLTFGRMLRVKSRTNKRKKRIWNANATNYLRNWNYRRLHCFVMTNGEKRGRISWNVCDECWKSSFNYFSAAALLDASMHSRESLYLNVVCLSSSLCSLRYSCILLPSLPTRPLISRQHRAAKRIPCVHAKTNETRSLKPSSVQGTTEVGGSISQFISNSTIFVIENLNNFIFLWQLARFFSFFYYLSLRVTHLRCWPENKVMCVFAITHLERRRKQLLHFGLLLVWGQSLLPSPLTSFDFFFAFCCLFFCSSPFLSLLSTFWSFPLPCLTATLFVVPCEWSKPNGIGSKHGNNSA